MILQSRIVVGLPHRRKAEVMVEKPGVVERNPFSTHFERRLLLACTYGRRIFHTRHRGAFGVPRSNP